MPDNVCCFQAFSAAQYKAMETPQVQAISLASRERLTTAQQDAIKSVINSDPDEVDPWGPDDDEDDDDKCKGDVTCENEWMLSCAWGVGVGHPLLCCFQLWSHWATYMYVI